MLTYVYSNTQQSPTYCRALYYNVSSPLWFTTSTFTPLLFSIMIFFSIVIYKVVEDDTEDKHNYHQRGKQPHYEQSCVMLEWMPFKMFR